MQVFTEASTNFKITTVAYYYLTISLKYHFKFPRKWLHFPSFFGGVLQGTTIFSLKSNIPPT